MAHRGYKDLGTVTGSCHRAAATALVRILMPRSYRNAARSEHGARPGYLPYRSADRPAWSSSLPWASSGQQQPAVKGGVSAKLFVGAVKPHFPSTCTRASWAAQHTKLRVATQTNPATFGIGAVKACLKRRACDHAVIPLGAFSITTAFKRRMVLRR